MPMFEIGERVRMLRDIHEGIVVKVKGGVIEIETDDGFVLPVIERELVKIHGMKKEEASSEKKSQKVEVPKQTKPSIYIGLEKISLENYRIHFINQTKDDLVGTLSFRFKGEIKNYAVLKVASYESLAVLGQFEMANFETWNKMHFQLLKFNEGELSQEPVLANIILKAIKVVSNETILPIVNKLGALFELETDVLEIEMPKLGNITPKQIQQELTIDLHAEKLGLHNESLDFLDLQYKEFLKAFDRCIHEEVPKLIVIHGVGKGLLKQKIHQFLATNDQIEHFRDAQKEKFGYGATEILF